MCHGISIFLVTEAGRGSPIFNQECGRYDFVMLRSRDLPGAPVPGWLAKAIGRVVWRNRLRNDTKRIKQGG